MKKTIVFAVVFLTFYSLKAQTFAKNRVESRQERLNNEYCTGLFKMHDGIILDLQNSNGVTNYLNILEWLQGRVAGLQIYHKKDGTPVPFIRNSKAGLFVDEIAVDPEYLNILPVSDIAIIKIIKGPFEGAFGNGTGGVISIYTLKGDDEEHGHE
jgi:hypothetical protein